MNRQFQIFTFLFFNLIWLIVYFVIGFDGLYGQDGYEYVRYSESLTQFFKEGVPPGDFFWPIMYSLAGSILSLLWNNPIAWLQLVSIWSLFFIAIYAVKIIQLLYTDHAKHIIPYILSLGILSPYMLRFGVSVMSDCFGLALWVVGIYHIIKYARNQQPYSICFSFLLLGFSIMTRYVNFVICLPFIIYGMSVTKFSLKRIGFLLIAVICLMIPGIPHFFIKQAESLQFINHQHLMSWSPMNMIQRKFINLDGTSINVLPNILYGMLGIFHPRYFLLGLPLLLLGIRKIKLNKEVQVFIITGVLYITFLVGIPFQNNRFLLPLLPIALFILYPSAQFGVSLITKKYLPMAWTGLILLQLTLSFIGLWPVWNRYQFEHKVIVYAKQFEPATIYTLDLYACLNGRKYKGKIKNLFSETLTSLDSNSIIIIQPDVLMKQWKGKLPEQNWKFINANYTLTEIRQFNNGWRVFKTQ